jgi:hypothetical protein
VEELGSADLRISCIILFYAMNTWHFDCRRRDDSHVTNLLRHPSLQERCQTSVKISHRLCRNVYVVYSVQMLVRWNKLEHGRCFIVFVKIIIFASECRFILVYTRKMFNFSCETELLVFKTYMGKFAWAVCRCSSTTHPFYPMCIVFIRTICSLARHYPLNFYADQVNVVRDIKLEVEGVSA